MCVLNHKKCENTLHTTNMLWIINIWRRYNRQGQAQIQCICTKNLMTLIPGTYGKITQVIWRWVIFLMLLSCVSPKSSEWSSGINVFLSSLWFLINFMKISSTSWMNDVKITARILFHCYILSTFYDLSYISRMSLKKKKTKRRKFLLVASYSTSSWWFACGTKHNMTMNPCHSDLQPLSV